GKPKDLALAPPQSAVETRSKVEQDFKALPTTLPPAKTAQFEASQAQELAKAAENPVGGEVERTIVTGANIPTAEEVGPQPAQIPASQLANRKLIRNATVELEIVSFDDALQKITAIANDERGYV